MQIYRDHERFTERCNQIRGAVHDDSQSAWDCLLPQSTRSLSESKITQLYFFSPVEYL